MGKNTKIICTIVPNPIRTKELKKEPGKEKFSAFSIFLTPRLPDSGILKDYFEIANWFKFFAFFTSNSQLKVNVAKLSPNDNTNTNYQLIEEYPKRLLSISRDKHQCFIDFKQEHRNLEESDYEDVVYYKLGENLWEKMFQVNTPVKGWLFDEGESLRDRITQLFTKDEIEKIITDADLDADLNDDLSVNIQNEVYTLKAFFQKFIYPTRSQIANSLSIQDIVNKKMTEDEIKLRNKENQEFHKKISILADYPHLLRLTGWIFDFQIEDPIPNDDYNIIKLDLSGLPSFIRNQQEASLWANFSNEIDFKTPWSYFDNKSFSIRYSEKLKDQYFEIENGFIKASGNSYELVACQFDHHQLKAKLINSTEANRDEIKDVVDKRTSDLTSTGIGVKVIKKDLKKLSPFEIGLNSNPDDLNSSIVINSKKNDSANIDDYIIFGHHLDNGYRVDVSMLKDDGTYTDFKSLCRRNADYKIDKSPYSDRRDFINLLTNFKDEPWISESAQAGKSGVLYVDEELCRWNNWSLTCPHIGNYPQDETSVHENHEFNDLELSNIKPTEKTLTPLRFLRKYKFRIRVVDICGNSSSDEEKTTNKFDIILKDNSNTKESFYQRLELVNPPELHFTENVYQGKLHSTNNKGVKDFHERSLKNEYFGEDLKTFVIKTRIENDIILPSSSFRSVCPPRVSQNFVELHGFIDNLFATNDRVLVYEKAAYENNDIGDEIFKQNQNIPFLTDPCVSSFSVIINELNVPPIEPIRDIWNQRGKEFIDRKFKLIELKCKDPKNGGPERISPSGESTIVEIRPGSIYKGTIQSFITNEEKRIFHNDSTLKDEKGSLEMGKHTQAIDLLFINAVQKPVIRETDGRTHFFTEYKLNGELQERTPSNPINIAFKSLIYVESKFPVSTAGEIKLIAEYEEIKCDKNSKHGFQVNKSKILIKSFSNFAEGISLKVEDDFKPERLLEIPEFKFIQHSFGDTKFRSVKYSFELISRYKDYFPNEKEFSVFGYFRKNVNGKYVSDYKQIPNSKKPEALLIDSIVPVFNWIEDKENKEITRDHNTFRLYLSGDWYQSGASIKRDIEGNLIKDKNEEYVFEEREKIAVFFLEEEGTIPDEYEGLVSEFGKDPTSNINIKQTANIKSTFFIMEEGEKIQNILISESDFMNIIVRNKEDQNITNSYKDKIKIAPYNIKFDSGNKKFFCDIKLNIKSKDNHYFPFVKFAVARYLKTSIKEDLKYDFRFSNIITTPQVQFFPVRTIKDPKGNFVITSVVKDVIEGVSLKNDYLSKKLEFYLILEKNSEGDFNKLIDNKTELVSVNSIRLDKQNASSGVVFLSKSSEEVKYKIDTFKPKHMYIEEFEVYNVFDTKKKSDFRIGAFDPNDVENLDSNYNPRNDIRKRLVFTYQIK